MKVKASVVECSLLGSVVCYQKRCPYSSIQNLSKPSHPLYKLRLVPSHHLRMSFATIIPNQLFCKPLLKAVGFQTSSAAFGKLVFVKPISFNKVPTRPISSMTSASSSQSSSGSLQPIEDLPLKLQEIVRLFQEVEQPKAKYEQLLFYGKNLKPLDAQYKTAENKVQGCVSQVWIRAFLDENKNVIFEADSDSVLTKGLAALLVQGLSGCSVDEIVRVSPDFAVLLGLQQSLTPSRNNGLLNMLKLMQRKAQMCGETENKGSSNPDEGAGKPDESMNLGVSDYGNGDAKTGVNSEETGGSDDKEVSRDSVALGSRGIRIRDTLEMELSPCDLHVEDVSYQHAGHAGIRGRTHGETHFNVKVISEKFEGKSLIKRHRLIYDLLQEELKGGLHALSITAKTPSEVSSK
ncbi:unnamed protein product [Cuscuta epithymum]|uniref:Fe-S metabolism associated domain-containing protein n=1 Tax=Cuscuta epithymum TaxID=186058 RepID=A0AAV0CQM0_9ASTE|nr:unnamed protein product [Cuscuta epithymum]